MKKVFVTGAGGFVGARIMTQLNERFEMRGCSSAALRAVDSSALMREIEHYAPDYIVHAAAISDTGYCQLNPDESYQANVVLSERVAKAASKVGAKLLCFSSDQVYTGFTDIGPFDELRELHPANVYGRHKLEAEQRVLDILPESVMMRATWMYDLPGYGLPIRSNLLLNLIQGAIKGEKLSFSTNDYRGITYVRQVIELLTMAFDIPGGVYNFGSENSYNMYETACDFCQSLGLSLELVADTSRPLHSLSMNCMKLREFGIVFDDTQHGLMRCISDYALDIR